jgi:hypothetical protein
MLMGAVAALILSSFLPIWTLWVPSELLNETVGYPVSAWHLARKVINQPLGVPNPQTGDLRDIILATVIFFIGASCGLIAHRLWSSNR